MAIKTIGVVGAGQMGNGITQVAAMSGLDVIMNDIKAEFVERGLTTITNILARNVEKGKMTRAEKDTVLGRIKTSLNLKDMAAVDFVVEAAIEKEELKFQIFRELDEICKPDVILASNTSSIPIGRIAAQTRRPDKVIGMHFMNPVPVMKLVEVIRGYETSDEVTQKVMGLSKALGKVPVEVNDYPGFVANRVLMPMINEAVYTLFEGVAGVQEIDTVMKLGMAHPMGPLQLADFIGLDVCLSIMRVLHNGLGLDKYTPCPLLVNMVMAGRLGVKSGQGFYDYSHGTKELVVAPRFAK
jgi:3-hydroxybutyryl-CoA dehydrogenase